MGWYEQTHKTNQRIDALEKEVKSLKDEMASLKRALTEKRINGREYLTKTSPKTVLQERQNKP